MRTSVQITIYNETQEVEHRAAEYVRPLPDGLHLVAPKWDGPALIQVHTHEGRLVTGLGAPPADYSAPAGLAPLEASDLGPPAVGLVYLGPAYVQAREKIAAAFGYQAFNIGHADATEEQFLAYHRAEPRAPLSVYIGTVPVIDKDTLNNVVTRMQSIEGDLFAAVVAVTEEQIEQAKRNTPGNELVPLIAE